MTIATDLTRITYTGDGVTVAFTFPFRILDASALFAYVNDTPAAILSIVGGTTDAGGLVTLVAPPAAGTRVTILRETPRLQPTNFTEHDSNSAETLELSLDRVTMLVEEIQAQLDRVIQFAPTTNLTGLSLAFPTPGAGQFIRWNGAGTALETATPSGGGGGGGTGVLSLGGLTGTLTIVNDSNVIITPAGTALTLGWSGLLPVARGGTGANTFPANSALIGAGSGPITFAPPVANSVLFSLGGTPFFSPTPTLSSLSIVGGIIDVTPPTANAVRLQPFGVGAGNTSELRFLELVANGVNFVGFKAPDSIASDTVWTLPSADGTAGQFLTTNGSKILSWATAGGGGIGTLNTQVGASQSFAKVDDTNVTLAIASVANVHTFTLGWTGTLAVARGGTGAAALTQGSVVFAGASGVYTQDNATLFWDNTNKRLGVGTAVPATAIHLLSAAAEARFEQSDAATNSVNGVLSLQHRTSVNMIDGFGVDMSYQIRDNAGVNNVIAVTKAQRAGADGTGFFSIQTAIASVLADRITVDGSGLVNSTGGLSITGSTGVNLTSIATGSQTVIDNPGNLVAVTGFPAQTAPTRHILTRGTNSPGDSALTPVASISRIMGVTGASCAGGGAGDYNCGAAMSIGAFGVTANTVQPIGLYVIAQNDTTTGSTAGVASQGDVGAIVGVAGLNVRPTNASAFKQAVGGYFEARRDVAGINANHNAAGVTFIHPLEIQTGNFSDANCNGTDTTNFIGSDCTGIAIFFKGTAGKTGGIGITLGDTAGGNQPELGYTCMGSGRGPTISCFADAATAQYGIQLNGTYSTAPIKLPNAAAAKRVLCVDASGNVYIGANAGGTGPVACA